MKAKLMPGNDMTGSRNQDEGFVKSLALNLIWWSKMVEEDYTDYVLQVS